MSNTQNNAKQCAKQRKNSLLYKELSYQLQGAAFEVYKLYRNSQKEIVYHNTLVEKLKEKNLYDSACQFSVVSRSV
jgi:hypothetical protein